MKAYKFSKTEIKKLRDELAELLAMRGDARYEQAEVIGKIRAIECTLIVADCN